MDLSALEVIGLEYAPVIVAFSSSEPTELPRLQKRLAFCEMLKETQENGAFYASFADHACFAGPYVLGSDSSHPVFESGRIGPALGVYADAEANLRVYAELPRMATGVAPYVSFARYDKADFDPDLLIITATPSQAEIVMRAHGYTSGAAWEARGTTVLGCAYLYVYPYLANKINLLVSGLHHGMKARNLFPEGLLFLSIPSPLISVVLENLTVMVSRAQIDLPQYHWGKELHERHMRELADKLGRAHAQNGDCAQES
jgi:uncharacterized protein (DUF169 family)